MKGIKRNGKQINFNYGGKRKSKSYESPAKAQEALKELEDLITNGHTSVKDIVLHVKEKEIQTVSFYIQLWLEGSGKETLKRSTHDDYRGILKNHINKSDINRVSVDKVTPLDVENFLLAKLKTRANSTVTHIRNCLSGGFKLAIRDRAININPCHGFKISTKQDDKREPQPPPLSASEIEALLDTFKKHRPEYYDLVLLLVRAGLRIGEAVALKWGDINFGQRFITVQRNFTRGRIETTTKNGKNRKVDMTHQLVAVLQKRKLRLQKETTYVFQSKGEKPIDPSNWRDRVFNPMLKLSGLRRVRVHDLRHSYASLLIQGSKDMHYAKEQLGHSSIKVTIDIYGHILTPEGKERPVDILDNLAAAGV